MNGTDDAIAEFAGRFSAMEDLISHDGDPQELRETTAMAGWRSQLDHIEYPVQ